MSLSNPICPVSADPQKLKHARDLIQKRLFYGKERSENLERTGVRTWGRDRGTQEDLQTRTHTRSRENMIKVEKYFRGDMCRDQKQGTNTESS